MAMVMTLIMITQWDGDVHGNGDGNVDINGGHGVTTMVAKMAATTVMGWSRIAIMISIATMPAKFKMMMPPTMR